jgi:aminopeptidase N
MTDPLIFLLHLLLFLNIAGSVLHTFLHAFGASTWRKGLNYYLNNRFNNFANSDHLYEGLQLAVSEDYPTSTPNVTAIMRSWEYQGGFPLINVARNETHVTISQERFLYGDDVSNSLWYVPINYYTGTNRDTINTTPLMWLSPVKETSIALNSLPMSWSTNEWAVFNTKQVKFNKNFKFSKLNVFS